MKTPAGLVEELQALFRKRVSIVCLGNSLQGDDAIGVKVGEKLTNIPSTTQVILAHTSPVNFTGLIEGFDPESVLFIDNVDAGLQPGQIIFGEVHDFPKDQFHTTHYQGLDVLGTHLKFLIGEHLEVYFLGIQTTHRELLAPVTDVMHTVSTALSATIQEAMHHA